MADLRQIGLSLPSDNHTMDLDENLDEPEDSERDQQGQRSFSTIGSGIMAFNDLSVPSPLDVTSPEELLTPLARLISFSSSDNIFNRRMIAHDACNVLESVQNDDADFETAVQCYLKLSEDLEPSVRVELTEQLLEITVRFQEKTLNSAVIPILVQYLTDLNNQVRKTCHSVLVNMTTRGFLKVEIFEDKIMGLLKNLASRREAPDEYRTEAISLICQICEAYGAEFAKEHFLPIFLESCRDETVFHLRKVCAANFSAFCDIFDNELINKDLLPRFVELCKDNVWGVRKACAEGFPDFAKHASEEIRINTLSPLFSGLLCDQSRWVRVAAFESLGPFISTFADSKRASDNLNLNPVGGNQIENGDSTNRDENVKSDFDAFLYWRDPIPPVSFEDGFDDLVAEDEEEEIQSQVYVNSQSPNEKIIIPTGESDSTDSKTQQEDDEYSPTKDDSFKSIEFSANKENLPIHFNINIKGEEADNLGNREEQETEDSSHDEYSDLNSVPSINLAKSDQSTDEKPAVDDGPSGEAKTETGSGDSGVFSGDLTVVKKEAGEKSTEIESQDGSDSGDSDDDFFDENEPKNWQTPNLCNYPDLYEPDSISDRCEIDYRIFSSALSNIAYNHMDRIHTNVSTSSKSSSQQDVIPQQLLDNFLSMTDPSRKQTVDTEIAKHCAYSLPGVAYTLGPNNWHCLKDVYQKLATDVQWKVRRTIASSIHELAKILGEELTATELVPVFNSFLKDLDDVRIGVLCHLADFLKLLKPEVRGIYLYQLTDFLTIDNSRNWRFRYELAKQLCSLIELYEPDDIVKYICPITMRLATDKVVAVQEEAARLIATLLAKLHDENSGNSRENYFEIFVGSIISALARSSKWKERALFCKLCNLILREVFLPFNTFLRCFSPALVGLAKDKIVNVRILAAKALSYATNTFCDEGEGEDICVALKELQNDNDRDVKFFAKV